MFAGYTRQSMKMCVLLISEHATIQPFYNLGHDKFADGPWGGMLVKTDLNAVLENVCAAMNHELGLAVDSHFGTDTKAWKDIDLMPTIRRL